ncbi:MAG: S24 family peptidase [Gammaproteobacteria bacterium]|nr:S24 family peptidase [Gammaproteobacteria bacterium]
MSKESTRPEIPVSASQGGCSAEASEPYALRVLGDSMEPEFTHGQIIIVDPGEAPVEGAFVVIDYGGEVMFGRYESGARGYWLRYLNPEHTDVQLVPPFEVKGVITQRVGRRRKDRKYYEYQAG